MFSKIYLALLGLSITVMAFFTYYSWSWLQSIGQPAAAVVGYEYHAGFAWTALWLSVISLMVLANAVLWATGRSWGIWTTLGYFAVLIVVRYFWLDQSFFQFKKTNGLFDGSFSVAPLAAVILIILMAAIAFFDQFIVVRLRAKTYAKTEEPVVETVETPAE